MTPTQAKPVQSSRPALPLRQLAFFGVGGLPYNIGITALKHLALPVYNGLLGVNPSLLGLVHMSVRLWEAFLDPVVGSWSDNARTRLGRRRPFILAGALLGALFFPLIWWVPVSASPQVAAGWFLVTGLAFYTSFAIFSVPYIGLSFELSSQYNERTKIAAARILFAVISALLISWSLHIIQWPIWGGPLTGMKILGTIMGGLFLLGGLPSALWLRERAPSRGPAQPRVSLFASARGTLGNRSFRQVLGLTLLMVTGVNAFEGLTFYVNTYYVFAGDIKRAVILQGIGMSIAALVTLAVVPAVTWTAARIGKAPAARLCLACGVLASASKWFLYDPAHPHWQLLVPILMAPCATGFWTLFHSMKADICDEEELRSGQRREGMVESVAAWVHKITAAIAFGVAGLLLTLTGFEQIEGSHQTPETLLRLRLCFAVAPCLFFLLSIAVLSRYRLDRPTIEGIQAELERRHAQAEQGGPSAERSAIELTDKPSWRNPGVRDDPTPLPR